MADDGTDPASSAYRPGARKPFRYQNAAEYQARAITVTSAPPASGSAQPGHRRWRTTTTLATKAPKKTAGERVQRLAGPGQADAVGDDALLGGRDGEQESEHTDQAVRGAHRVRRGAQAGQPAVHPQREKQLDQSQSPNRALPGWALSRGTAWPCTEAAPVLRGVYPAVPDEAAGHRQGQQQPQKLPGFGARGEACM
ncbi:hypothetical protein GCM10010121_026180 [Streptomyces brasiliensis]|uniref:Uncharacterized protein n=1 Tax=Streptomyces brasiliensis TaxID=1954 RepID=A0A917KJ49_9ACTN|nr:hypothetical protein GCM10010121_026180 [Streptomyces brasiliensis]